MYTGGTTGLPKGVVWRHADLFGALAFNGYASLGLPVPDTPDEVGRVAAELRAAGASPVNMTAPPLMHGTGLFLAMSTFFWAERWCCWRDGGSMQPSSCVWCNARR